MSCHVLTKFTLVIGYQQLPAELGDSNADNGKIAAMQTHTDDCEVRLTQGFLKLTKL